MTHKVARNTREILNKQEAISVLLEISQCFMAQMTGITVGFHMSLDGRKVGHFLIAIQKSFKLIINQS